MVRGAATTKVRGATIAEACGAATVAVHGVEVCKAKRKGFCGSQIEMKATERLRFTEQNGEEDEKWNECIVRHERERKGFHGFVQKNISLVLILTDLIFKSINVFLIKKRTLDWLPPKLI